MSSVDSYFFHRLNQRQGLRPNRVFTIGSSDYSDYVLKWPVIRDKWDEIRPSNVSINLSNADGTFNFLHNNPVNMVNTCGFQFVYGGTNFLKHSQNMDITNVWSANLSFPSGKTQTISGTAAVAPDGTQTAGIVSVNSYAGSPGYDAGYVTAINTVDSIQLNQMLEGHLHICGHIRGSSTTSTNSEAIRVRLLTWASSPVFGSFTQQTPMLYINPNSGQEYMSAESWGIDRYIMHLTKMSSDWVKFDFVCKPITNSNYNLMAFEISKSSTLSAAKLLPASFDLWGFQVASCGGFLGVSSDYTRNQDGFTVWSYQAEQVNRNYLDKFVGYIPYYQPTSDTVFGQDSYSIYEGEIESISNNKASLILNITDKYDELAKRTVGTEDSPVTINNTLVSDLVWTLCTCYGGLSSVQSTSNPDIDYEKFLEWAAVFSSDSTNMDARLTGQKVSEVVSRIANQTESAVYRASSKIAFSRFTIVGRSVDDLTPDNYFQHSMSHSMRDIVNRQKVSFNYDTTSRIHADTVTDQNTSSVNSFGLREKLSQDQVVWYTNSPSAINLAQRKTFIASEPYMKTKVKVGMQGILYNIGDMVTLTNEAQGVYSRASRIMGKSINLNDGSVDCSLDESQILEAFRLDISSLSDTNSLGTEVLA